MSTSNRDERNSAAEARSNGENATATLLVSSDFARLEIIGFQESGPTRQAILAKLALAHIKDSAQMPPDVATIGSVVRYSIADGAVERRTLSLPENSRPTGQFISVLTPVGLALLGRRAGEKFNVELADGGSLKINLVAVEFQPEAEARKRTIEPPHDDGPEAA